jgi:membrane-anchored protein YejM (alkaline phosphatase superfamily)
LGFAVVLVFQLAHLLASPPTPRLLVVIAATLVATILLMSAAHDQARITNGIPRLAMSGQDSGKR